MFHSAVVSKLWVGLQNSKLIAGDVYTNIVGASLLTHESLGSGPLGGAGFRISSSCPGLHTVISEGRNYTLEGQRHGF